MALSRVSLEVYHLDELGTLLTVQHRMRTAWREDLRAVEHGRLCGSAVARAMLGVPHLTSLHLPP